MTFKSFNFEKNCKPIKMTLTWNIPNYFLLKTKNTQNTLTTIYSKQILVPNTYPTFHWLSRKSLKTVMMIIKMCLNTRSNNIHNTDGHVIKNFAIGLCSEKKNG